MLELIKKKRDGQALNEAEFEQIVNGFVAGQIPDYQMAAFLMAVYFRGLNTRETAILTNAMMRSGELINLAEIPGIKVDKHSTGGVGDKTTLVLAPLVAAAGVPVAKMSGRGLGHTGGTLDKLESISGFSVDLSKETFIENILKYGIAVCGQNDKLVPADKKIYALRDVTATVDNISLISSSIMSKKLACGADAIVIDIKVGEGAYMKTVEEAEQLAEVLIETGKKMGRAVVAVVSAMYEPLGYAVGNALEVKEAIDTLKGKGPADLTQLCLELGGHMMVLAQKAGSKEEGIALLKKFIDSGAAFEKFKTFVKAQGGAEQMIEHPDLLPSAQFSYAFKSKMSGYLHQLNALDIGQASVVLGAGRANKESIIDPGAGIILKKKCGDQVKVGEVLALLFTNQESYLEKAIPMLEGVFKIDPKPPEPKPLILKVIS